MSERDSPAQKQNIFENPVGSYDDQGHIEIPVVETQSAEIAEAGEAGQRLCGHKRAKN